MPGRTSPILLLALHLIQLAQSVKGCHFEPDAPQLVCLELDPGGCIALAYRHRGSSCTHVCNENGMSCVEAWDPERDGCVKKEQWGCDQLASAMLCHCQPSATQQNPLALGLIIGLSILIVVLGCILWFLWSCYRRRRALDRVKCDALNAHDPVPNPAEDLLGLPVGLEISNSSPPPPPGLAVGGNPDLAEMRVQHAPSHTPVPASLPVIPAALGVPEPCFLSPAVPPAVEHRDSPARAPPSPPYLLGPPASAGAPAIPCLPSPAEPLRGHRASKWMEIESELQQLRQNSRVRNPFHRVASPRTAARPSPAAPSRPTPGPTSLTDGLACRPLLVGGRPPSPTDSGRCRFVRRSRSAGQTRRPPHAHRDVDLQLATLRARHPLRSHSCPPPARSLSSTPIDDRAPHRPLRPPAPPLHSAMARMGLLKWLQDRPGADTPGSRLPPPSGRLSRREARSRGGARTLHRRSCSPRAGPPAHRDGQRTP